ncbi:helix-turn-helix domain-containing protein [Dactylosporangium sp. NPDC049140]|uniref:winged helix-turn-helix transcriptional regulator n=1 Tax=Dactylosporangium sp. NPDC049140 TaxID=3155647 RepID=UPI003405D7AF
MDPVRRPSLPTAPRPRPGTLLPAGADPSCPQTCATRQTLARLADRWTVQLLDRLATAPHRFGELRASTPGISEKMLTQTLRSLERDGLVRTSDAGYALTPLGLSLLEPLSAVRMWARTNMSSIDEARRSYDGPH